jgi:hypothetical protein
MKYLALVTAAGLALSGASTVVSAQNAVVNQGSGAVNPLGPGESSGTAGIGGSGTSAPPSGMAAPSSGMVTGSTVPRTVIVPAPGTTDSSNAVTEHGSGAVNPLGPGESSGSAGIGGSGTSAPRQ